MARKPLVLANWKMTMGVVESLTFVRDFQARAGDLTQQVDVILCPPCTALWAIAATAREAHLHLGAQNLAASDEPAQTGEISAALLAEAGARWAMVGHWEVRRRCGDDEDVLNRKVRVALAAGLTPIIFVGPARDDATPLFTVLERQLARTLAGCGRPHVAGMVFVFEPEEAIGAARPWSPERAAAGPAFIRGWLAGQWGDALAEGARILYGGSVTPEHAGSLLAFADVDGLGVGRGGRTAASLADIARQVARMKRVE